MQNCLLTGIIQGKQVAVCMQSEYQQGNQGNVRESYSCQVKCRGFQSKSRKCQGKKSGEEKLF